MFKQLKCFVYEQDGQDFAKYTLILGAIGVVAIAVIARYRNELQAAFEAGIRALQAARWAGVNLPEEVAVVMRERRWFGELPVAEWGKVTRK